MSQLNITNRTVAAVGWLTLARIGAKIIDFGLLIVFGRVLSPADFGLVALAMTLIVMLELIADLPSGAGPGPHAGPSAGALRHGIHLIADQSSGAGLALRRTRMPFAWLTTTRACSDHLRPEPRTDGARPRQPKARGLCAYHRFPA